MARVIVNEDVANNERVISIHLEKQFDVYAEASAIRKAMVEAARLFAEKWLEENRDKVIERLNVDAIANMIMVEVANDIKNQVREKK